MRAKWVTGVVVVTLACSGMLARGEVSAKLDEDGQYLGMYIKYTTTTNPPKYWSSSVPTPTRRPINATGDYLGDLAPVIVQNAAEGFKPWLIWQHPNGGDLDLVYSRWTGTGWMPVAFVQSDNFSNEYDPRFQFNSTGRGYLVWWSADGTGPGTVWFSMYLASRWMTPMMISGPAQDSRNPTLKIYDDLHIAVIYATNQGQQSRIVTIPTLDTITDDIDPQIRSQIIIQ